jgi:hypothetical protein
MIDSFLVSCPACARPARIPRDADGMLVECPHCTHQYVARQPSSIPTVQPRTVQPPPASQHIPVVFRHPRYAAKHSHDNDTGTGLVALALLSLGVPLLWLILTLVAPPSAFSFAAPVAVALSVTVMAFALAQVSRWNRITRMWALLLLHGLAYGSSVVFYFAPPQWLEVAREFAVFNSGLVWKEYNPPETKFRVSVPTGANADVEYLIDWNLSAKSFVHKRKPVDRFIVAHGSVPKEHRRKQDEEFWPLVVEQLTKQHGQAPTRESIAPFSEANAHDYYFELPDGSTRLVIRVIRPTTSSVVVLYAEGPYLTVDRPDVQHFVKSYRTKVK